MNKEIIIKALEMVSRNEGAVGIGEAGGMIYKIDYVDVSLLVATLAELLKSGDIEMTINEDNPKLPYKIEYLHVLEEAVSLLEYEENDNE